MLISEFLGFAARSIEAGIPILPKLAPKGWGEYAAMTLPQSCDFSVSAKELVETRVMRFLLAAEIARSEGK